MHPALLLKMVVVKQLLTLEETLLLTLVEEEVLVDLFLERQWRTKQGATVQAALLYCDT